MLRAVMTAADMEKAFSVEFYDVGSLTGLRRLASPPSAFHGSRITVPLQVTSPLFRAFQLSPSVRSVIPQEIVPSENMADLVSES